MIIIQPLDGTPAEHFETFDQLFECILTTESLKVAAKTSNAKLLNWNFTIHAAKEVVGLFTHSKKPPEVLKEAFEERLPLIEICTGDYKHPLHIVLTPNVDMGYLRKKWCVDYCTYHDLLLREV